MIATAVRFSPHALSEYLALRWLALLETAWFGAYAPDRSTLSPAHQTTVTAAEEVLECLTASLSDVDPSTTALLLSGGIDSAILARLAPSGLRAYTLRFLAPSAVDESPAASHFASLAGLRHQVVDVTWADYEQATDWLTLRKRSPLHAVEVGLYKAALRASADGITTLIVGNGADSTFGGLDKLLARDWSPEAFKARYTFVDPRHALREPGDSDRAFAPWCRGAEFDTAGFLKIVHGEGVTQAFMNAIGAAGCVMRAPYEELVLGAPLDLARIRGGESKYILRDVFRQLYGTTIAPEKIAFARPMDHWLRDWRGPVRPEFRPGLDMDAFTGEQRWLIWGLDRFLSLVERLHG
jgi:asparagine synthetase B (glutamine-hydrolysing)